MEMSVEEFVNFIILNSTKGSKRNVTAFPLQLVPILNSKDVSKINFHSIPDNLERIRKFKELFGEELETALDKEVLSSIGKEPLGIDLVRKSERISELLREKGNEYFKREDFQLSLRCFTLSGMFAPKGTKVEALSYSNRSAVFARKRNWKLCLKDVERFETLVKEGITAGEGTNQRVGKQKEQCLQKLGKSKERNLEKQFGMGFFKLTNPSETVPSAVDFIGVKMDAKKGRSLFNNGGSSIEPGTVVILEEPYAHVPYETFCFQTKNCSACYSDLNGGGIPCSGCVFNIYCSEDCATSAFHKLHFQYECKISPYLYELNLTRMSHLAFLTLLKLGPEEFRKLQDVTSPNPKIGGFNESDYDSNSYLPLANQIYHDSVVSRNELFINCKDALLLTKILDFGTDYFSSLNLGPAEAEAIKENFQKTLLYHMLCVSVNANTMTKMDLPVGPSPTAEEIATAKEDKVGVALYPVSSLLNHSCNPNVIGETLPGGNIAFIALQYIVPGQELCTSYGPHYMLTGRSARRTFLKEQYGFFCECDACENDWTHSNVGSDLLRLCPECVKRFGLKIMLTPKPNAEVATVECGRCKWKITENEMSEMISYYNNLSEEACQAVFHNEPVKGLVKSTKCAKEYISRVFDQESMKQALWLIARRMFE